MSERAPAFQFYPRQFSGDQCVMAMDLDVVGAHILLMCAAASSASGYMIPSNERSLRVILRNPSDYDWYRMREQLLDGPWKVTEDGLWWVQEGLKRTLERRDSFSQKQKIRALKRWEIPYKRDSSVAVERKRDYSVEVEQIAQAYPNNKHLIGTDIPVTLAHVILEAIAADGVNAVLLGTRRYAAAVERWPAKDRKFIPKADKWFREKEYLRPDADWVRGEEDTYAIPKARGKSLPQKLAEELAESAKKGA